MTTTDKANFIIDITSLKEFCDFVGMVPHTLYKRLATEKWKNSESIAVDKMYDSLKKKARSND
jgi:hypothetical protein